MPMYSQFIKNNVSCMLYAPGSKASENVDAIVSDYRDFISKTTEEWKEDLSNKRSHMNAGSFLVVLLPGESADNYRALYEFKCVAVNSGFRYYASIPCDRDNTVADEHRFCDSDTVLFLSADSPATDTLKWLPGRFNISDARCGSRYYVANHSADLYVDIIECIAACGATVLFDFAGSGVPGMAALMSRRNSILMSGNMNEYLRAHDTLYSCSILKGVMPLD